MSQAEQGLLEQRVLSLVPTSKDASVTRSVFQTAGIPCFCCSTIAEMGQELDKGAGAILLPEEAILQHRKDSLMAWLNRQPPWSDLPVLVLARRGADSAAVAEAMDLLGNVTVLERPTRVAALVSSVRSALRARQRQYQLRDYLDALKVADRRKDEFLAILAHELRNPLAPLSNSLHVLRLGAKDDPAALRINDMMERQVSYMVRLVDDLLEISRITSGKIELRKGLVEMDAVLRSAVETSRPLIEAARHRLSIVIPPQRLIMEGDGIRLAQVFANLLNNAAKYTDEGGEISVIVVPEGQGLTVTVRDTGSGIPAEMLPRVFELFTQVKRSKGGSREGLGIGLTLVKSLVEMHGGRVQARSAGIGRGSEFEVWLPLAIDPHPAQIRQHDKSSNALALHRILVVDDNRDAADSLGMLLELLGASVQVVYNGSDALEVLQTYLPDVVLLDIGMPDMDGYEVARRIRKQPGLEKITLIALTGWGQAEDRRRSQMAGFDHHLIKPPDVDELETLLRARERAH